MEISKKHFLSAALKLGIPKEQVEALWTSLENSDKDLNSSPFSKWMFYFGALIIISAMTWLMGLSWEWFGGGAIFLISVTYAFLFTLVGTKLWKKEELKIPAGLLITIAVCMTPLAIYGLETYLKIWPEDYPENYKGFFHTIKSSWIFMELGTIFAGLVALRFFPFPFLTAPIFCAAWFFTMDIVPLLIGNESAWERSEWISLCFGIALVFIAYLIDRKKMKDYAFWGYFFGTLTFWISLTSLVWNKGEFIHFVYLLINLCMMIFSILLKRRVFMIFGAIGAMIYFGHLAYEIFENSILFPFALSFIGLLIIYLGVLYQKNSGWIERKIIGIIPLWIKNLLPFEHED